MSSFSDFFFGKPEQVQQLQNFSPEQQQILNQLLGGAGGQLPQMFEYLQKILSQDPELMAQFETPTLRAFNEQTIPSIAERFSGMGAQRSSAFGQQLGQAGERLQEGLAANRANLGGQAINQLQSLLNGGLTQQFTNVLRPQTQGALGGILGGLGQGLGMGLGYGGAGGIASGAQGLWNLIKSMGGGNGSPATTGNSSPVSGSFKW